MSRETVSTPLFTYVLTHGIVPTHIYGATHNTHILFLKKTKRKQEIRSKRLNENLCADKVIAYTLKEQIIVCFYSSIGPIIY